MKKTLFLLFFVFILCSISVYADELEPFSDVGEEDYYYDAVMYMKEKGYVEGYGNNFFGPQDFITVSESLAVLFRIMDVPLDDLDGEFWYVPIIAKGVELGIVSEEVDPSSYATRNDIAEYIIKILDLDTSNIVVQNVFLDTNSDVANIMYQYGIFVGAPFENGVIFMPEDYIKRGDICLSLTRVDENILNSSEILLYNNQIVHTNPTMIVDFFKLFDSVQGNELNVVVPYSSDLLDSSYYFKIRNNAFKAHKSLFSMKPERFSFTPSLYLRRVVSNEKTGAGKIDFLFRNNYFSSENILDMKESFDTSCESVIENLYLSGELVDTMSTLEKVSKIFEFVVYNTEYDYDYNAESYTGFGGAVNGLAVCQGYTAYFNNLCNLIGLETKGVTGEIKDTLEEHMWSKIKIDDEWHYFDTTFADPLPNEEHYCDMSYFDIPLEQLLKERNIIINI